MSRTRTSTRRSARAASLLAAAGLGAGLLTACQPPAATFVVNTGVDAVDANVGDGLCATSAGDCSLRAAVQEGNANPNTGPIEVQLSLEVHTLTIPGGNEQDAAVGDLDLTRPFRFVGTGLPRVSNTGDRVFEARAGAHLEVTGLEVSGRAPTGLVGGAIQAVGANVTVTGSVLSGVSPVSGGAIHVSGGVLTVADSAIVKSSAPQGAAIVADQLSLLRSSVSTSAASTAFIIRLTPPPPGQPFRDNVIDSSTLVGNTSPNGPTVSASGNLTVRDTTVVGNDSVFDFVVSGDEFVVGNSILASATPGDECANLAPTVSLGGNLEMGTSCGFTAPGDLQSAPSTGLGAAVTTGLTVSLPPVAPPALDGGVGCLATDQHLAARPLDGNADGTVECDRGAREVAATPMVAHVDTLTDAVDAAPGDGVCATAGGGCTLRAAVMETNVRQTTDEIVLPVGQTSTLSIPGTGEDAAATGDLDITDDVTITGDEDSAVAFIDAADLDRVFEVHTGTVTLSNLSMGNGAEPLVGGGALRTKAGTTVTVRDSRIGVSTSPGGGGGIRAGGTFTLDRSAVFGNDGAASGGGVLLEGSTVATIVNSTITGNTATTGAGFTSGKSSTVTVIDSTIAGNTGVGIHRGTSLTIGGSIVSGNTAGNCSSAVTSAGHNLDSGTTCGFTATGDAQSTDPLLGALFVHSGPTPTLKPAATSPAVNTSTCATATDQRGVARPQGGACDKGSHER